MACQELTDDRDFNRTMNENIGKYEVLPYPRIRQIIIDSGRLSHRKHTVRGLFEIDVTNIRKFIRRQKEKTGESLSFTAFVIACLGQAVAANRFVHAYRNLRNKLFIFEDVDVLTYIEIEVDGEKFPLAYIVRAANRKTWREIHDEIRSIQQKPEQSPNARLWNSMRFFMLLPGFIRNIIFRLVNRSPQTWKKYVGTVYLTSVGMFGTGGGWGIGFSAHTLGITIGGISEQVKVYQGQIEIRECLNLTADFDHDLVDGAPAARFTEQFKKLLENGADLAELTE